MSTLNVNGRNHTIDADPGWRDSRHWKISTPDVLNRATGVLSLLDDPAPLSSTPLIALQRTSASEQLRKRAHAAGCGRQPRFTMFAESGFWKNQPLAAKGSLRA